jgi:Na+-driven multidrug efflux pump
MRYVSNPHQSLQRVFAITSSLFLCQQNDPGKASLFAADKDDEYEEISICRGSSALFSKQSINHAFNVLVDVAHYDHEMKDLLKLGIPFTIAGALESVWDAIAVVLISRYLGIESLTAYIITNLLLGLTENFAGGISGSLETLCSHAIGASNYFLAGQYVQIASVVYILVSGPLLGLWCFIMGDCIRLFGFNEAVVAIGVKYTKIVIFDYLVAGIFDNLYTLLDINGQVTQATLFDFVTGATDCAVTWVMLAFVEDVDLYLIGLSMLLISVVHYLGFTLISYFMGWLNPFIDGMVKNFALKNVPAIKNITKTAIPLSIGYFLEYGEVSLNPSLRLNTTLFLISLTHFK